MRMMVRHMNQRIAINPNIHFGKPCVAGTRITVQSVLELIRKGVPFDQIIREYYPDLKPDDLRACVEADACRREDFDRYLAAVPDVEPPACDRVP